MVLTSELCSWLLVCLNPSKLINGHFGNLKYNELYWPPTGPWEYSEWLSTALQWSLTGLQRSSYLAPSCGQIYVMSVIIMDLFYPPNYIYIYFSGKKNWIYHQITPLAVLPCRMNMVRVKAVVTSMCTSWPSHWWWLCCSSVIWLQCVTAGAGGVVHSAVPGHYMRDREPQRSRINAVRNTLKMLNFSRFGTMLEAFRYYDQAKNTT